MSGFFIGVKEGMHEFGRLIGGIINAALLFVVYVIGVGITSVIAKFTGKHFLEMRQGKKSYWTTLNLKKKPLEAYYRQF